MVEFKQRPDKYSLIQGLTQWLVEKTGIPNAHMPNMSRLTEHELLLWAIATGYEPPFEVHKWLIDDFRRTWEARHGKDKPFPLTITVTNK